MKSSFVPEGVYGAMITPFASNGKIDEEVVERLVDFYICKGIDGVFAVSNVGEFPCLTADERKRLIDQSCSKGCGKLKVCSGVSDINFDVTIKLAEHSARRGADAVVISAPSIYKYRPEYVESFIRTFLEQTPLPVIFYNSPMYANPVSFDFLIEIMAHPNVIALKDSSGDAILLQKLIARCEDEQIDTPVLIGFEDLCLTGLVHGAKGSMTSSGGIVPELMIELTKSFKEGNINRAIDIQKSVSRIASLLASYGLPHGYKLGMVARGFSFNIIQSPKLFDYENYLKGQVDIIRELIVGEFSRLKIKY